jgi:hypothetical protein
VRAQRPQRVFERLGRVREVDHDEERLAAIHALHPPRDGRQLGRRGDHVLGRGAKLERRRRRREPVGDVEPTEQRRRHGHLRARRIEPKRRAARVEPHVPCHHIGWPVDAVAPDRYRAVLPHRLGRRVVRVDDPDARPGLAGRLAEHLEQASLGESVLVERAVKVEVFGTEVGEDGHVEGAVPDAVEGQRVRAGLQHGHLDAGRDHLGQHRLDPVGFRRRVVEVIRTDQPAHVHVDRRQPADAPPGLLHDGGQQARGGRLAVRPGHPDEPELARRVPVERRRDVGQGGASRGNEYHGSVRRRLDRRLAHDDRRASFERLGHELAGVVALARHGDEQEARLDCARVVSEARDRSGRVALDKACAGHVQKKIVQEHGVQLW